MARTVLMHSLQRLAANHRAAERLGWPAEAIAERRCRADELRSSRGQTRREFLAGAATLALPGIARGRAGARIAIVGAGIAGLTCALQLRRYGIGCTIYEGSRSEPALSEHVADPRLLQCGPNPYLITHFPQPR